MKPQEFCYWLQGYFEVSGDKELNAEKLAIVKRHLSLVFATYIDPQTPGNPTIAQVIHDGNPPSAINIHEQTLYRC